MKQAKEAKKEKSEENPSEKPEGSGCNGNCSGSGSGSGKCDCNGKCGGKCEDYKQTLQRLQAEFENFKKRIDKEKIDFRNIITADVIKSFLPVLDSFELALKTKESDSKLSDSEHKMVKGLEMIFSQFYSALESQGLAPIKSVGEKLDPYRHEVLMQQETSDESKDGFIAEELQKGYLCNDEVIRFSKVKVLKYVGGKENE
jgi:molecular chaperone GrpE